MIEGHRIIEAPPCDGKSVRIGTRYVKAFNAAHRAELMFRSVRIEGVGRKSFFAGKKSEPAGRHDDMRVLAHQAYRTIAVLDFDALRQEDFKPDGAAMAAALMPGHIISHRIQAAFYRTMVSPLPAGLRGGREELHGHNAHRTSCQLADCWMTNAEAQTWPERLSC